MTYHLLRPGVSVAGDGTYINTPTYPWHYSKPKVGDEVYVIVLKPLPDGDDDFAIDKTTIVEVSNFYEEAVRQYEYRQKVLSGELETPIFEGEAVDFSQWIGDTRPDPKTEPDYVIDFWINKYNPGHSVDFGECLYETFEEAKFVFAQYFTSDHEMLKNILNSSFEDLRPDNDD